MADRDPEAERWLRQWRCVRVVRAEAEVVWLSLENELLELKNEAELRRLRK